MLCVEVHEDSNNPVYFVCCETGADVMTLRLKLEANEDFGYGIIASVDACDKKECPKEEVHEVSCSYCDDRGCVQCEPWRFIRL